MTGGSMAVTRGGTTIDVAVDLAGTWTNQMLTRGIIWLVGKGAMWPNPEPPRGTPLLAHWFMLKICLVARPGVEPVTSGR